MSLSLMRSLKSWMADLSKKFGLTGGEKYKIKTFPRAPRVQILPLHHIAFHRTEPPEERELTIANISSSGMGFFKDSASYWPEQGKTIRGTLTLAGKNFSVSAVIMRVSEIIIGCRFVSVSNELELALDDYFKKETAAIRLTQIRSDMLQPVMEGTPFHFIGDDNCSLYYVQNGTDIVHFYLTFFGSYIEGGKDLNLVFGEVIEEPLPEKPTYKASEIVRPVFRPSPDFLRGAVKFVQNVELASPGARTMIASMISERIPS